MSLLQEMQMFKRMIDEENDPALKRYYQRTSSALEDYCNETGADLGKALYTITGWREFENWRESRENK